MKTKQEIKDLAIIEFTNKVPVIEVELGTIKNLQIDVLDVKGINMILFTFEKDGHRHRHGHKIDSLDTTGFDACIKKIFDDKLFLYGEF